MTDEEIALEAAGSFGFGAVFVESRPALDIFAETTHEEDLMSLAGIVARLEKRGHNIALDITSPTGKKKRLTYKTPAPESLPEKQATVTPSLDPAAGLVSEEVQRKAKTDPDSVASW